jgi:hypothetical protein
VDHDINGGTILVCSKPHSYKYVSTAHTNCPTQRILKLKSIINNYIIVTFFFYKLLRLVVRFLLKVITKVGKDLY